MQKQELWFKPSGFAVRNKTTAMHFKWWPNNWFMEVSLKYQSYKMRHKVLYRQLNIEYEIFLHLTTNFRTCYKLKVSVIAKELVFDDI